jgi:Rrf2 family protein
VHIPAKVDYGLRALLVLAASAEPMTSRELASDQELPAGFLSAIMNELRRAGLVTNQRGQEGGYRLARPADEISLADVMRVLDGPLARVRGLRPEATDYSGSAKHLQVVWIAVRANLRNVLERVTLFDVIEGRIPAMASEPSEESNLRPAPTMTDAPRLRSRLA